MTSHLLVRVAFVISITSTPGDSLYLGPTTKGNAAILTQLADADVLCPFRSTPKLFEICVS
jgi:hypothetical protein